MYQQTSISPEINGGSFSPATHAYLGRRAQNKYYDYVMAKFRASGMTQAELARRIGKGADRVNRLLSNPGNWTVETAAVLLAGICGEELLPHSLPFAGRAKRNMRQCDVADITPHPKELDQFYLGRSQVHGSAKIIHLRAA
jgi:hypothetical protein